MFFRPLQRHEFVGMEVVPVYLHEFMPFLRSTKTARGWMSCPRQRGLHHLANCIRDLGQAPKRRRSLTEPPGDPTGDSRVSRGKGGQRVQGT